MSGVFCFDIEATGLLDDSTVDYCASPWRLKDNFKIHCIVAIDVETGDTYEFVQEDCYTKFPKFAKDNIDTIIGANIINYDLLVLKAACGMDYTVGPDTWCGKPVKIIDTLILSKTLNPDRKGHSIEYFGEILGEPKIDWRGKAIELGLIPHNAPRGAEFQTYHPEMLVYNRQDVVVNIKTYHYLMKEWGDWPWEEAFQLEQAVAEIITRQSHRGFWFDKDLAIANIKELDTLMEECRSRVEPNLPEKPMGKTKLKEYIPCKNQFLKNGKPNSNIEKWVAKHGGTIVEDESGYHTTLYGKSYTLPIPQEPIVSSEPSSIEDTTFIKGILVEMGWHPSSYKERDLTLDTRKQKLSQEKFIETVERYVEQTLASPFVYDRCERVNTTPAKLRNKLLGHDIKKPLKVYTNPTFTVGQEKELDPTLEKLYEKFPYVEDIVHFLTYRHRRNSILGGGMDYDEWEEDDDATAKGFLANVRADGRIPTPADSCGCASSRMKHRICANIPRVTSLYGEKMRALFGVDPNEDVVQHAYDFSSLESFIEAHYCFRYDKTKEYCESLLKEKPNDVHSVTAKKIGVLIDQAFSRQSAKSVKYASSYGAQAAKIAKTIGCDLATGERVFNAFWEAAKPLADLKAAVAQYWKTTGGKKFIPGLDGRKLNSRSEHSLLNLLFQAAGVICAKKTTVLLDRKLREQGLLIDYWKDDRNTKLGVQSLILYHDEQQSEFSKRLARWKKFETKEEMKEFQQENPKWATVTSSKGFFLGHSIIDELLEEAVAEASNTFKLHYPLRVEAIYGLNWAGCH